MEFPVLWSVLCNLIWFGGDQCSETLARPSYSKNSRVNKPFILLKQKLANQSILVLEKKALGEYHFSVLVEGNDQSATATHQCGRADSSLEGRPVWSREALSV